MSANKANIRYLWGEYRVRVMCPECGAGGGQDLESYHPKCHICEKDVYMQPANNTEIVCTWNEAVAFMNEKLKPIYERQS